MLEVHSVYATVRLPSDDDTGQITIGYFTLADDVLTMTNPKGVPVRRPITGEKIQRKIAEGDDPKAIASRLTKDIRLMLHGETDFNRRLDYSRHGVA